MTLLHVVAFIGISSALILLCCFVEFLVKLDQSVYEWRKNRERRRKGFITNTALNAYRVTPQFKVGSDAK